MTDKNDTISRKTVINYCKALIDAEGVECADKYRYGRERINQTEEIMFYVEELTGEPSAKQVLSKVREEIAEDMRYSENEATKEDIDDGIIIGLQMALDTIDKYIGRKECNDHDG